MGRATQPGNGAAENGGMEDQRATGNRQPATGNAEEQATGNRQQATGNAEEQATGNRQQATGNAERELRMGANIAERLLGIAVAVLRLTRSVKKDFAGRHVCAQVIRAVTSSGANYEEARASESRQDFIHKVGLAQKEMRETAYWLRIIQQLGEPTEPLLHEAQELSAILGASLRTARARDTR